LNLVTTPEFISTKEAAIKSQQLPKRIPVSMLFEWLTTLASLFTTIPRLLIYIDFYIMADYDEIALCTHDYKNIKLSDAA